VYDDAADGMNDPLNNEPSFLNRDAGVEIILCAGPGGVGKTTSSASIALSAAKQGKSVLVLTIDPAKRLADALGIDLTASPNAPAAPVTLAAELFEQAGIEMKGSLAAMMLEPSQIMDDLIMRLAPQKDVANKILSNVIYQQLSRSLAGSLEYAAAEKLYDLRHRFNYDLIVVDTPPSKNVLDFIEAPDYLQRFMDDKVLKWFLLLDPNQPSEGFAKAIMKQTTRLAWEVLSRALGKEFLNEIRDFILAIESITQALRHRCESISQLFRSSQCVFVIVSSTDDAVIDDAVFLQKEILDRGLKFGGFVINQVYGQLSCQHLPKLLDEQAQLPKQCSRSTHQKVLAELKDVVAWTDMRAKSDSLAITTLCQKSKWLGDVILLPKSQDDINDLKDLDQLGGHLNSALGHSF
jgi:anion-transporting  ArsA/GET3 family ATPase